MKNKTVIIIILILSILIGTIYALYVYNYLPHRKYTNADFNIETYKSSVDLDNDGIDDQTDILNNVRTYIATKPKYKSKYYDTGYPNDNYGVCTDVVAFGLKGAGYNLQELVDKDIRENRSKYNIKTVDKNIDFRRVRNLKIYFDTYAISLSTSLDDINDWQGGDIVIFPGHIGIVSDKRNKDGIPFLIHHANPYQRYYEEDVLKMYKIEGHYRIS